MKLLRRVLYWHAVALAAIGLALAIVPGSVSGLLGQPGASTIWLRLVGIQAVGFALMQVIIGHRVETLWWFSWTFVLVSAAAAAAALGHAALGVAVAAPTWPWWTLAGWMAAATAGLLVGLARTGLERPAE